MSDKKWAGDYSRWLEAEFTQIVGETKKNMIVEWIDTKDPQTDEKIMKLLTKEEIKMLEKKRLIGEMCTLASLKRFFNEYYSDNGSEDRTCR